MIIDLLHEDVPYLIVLTYDMICSKSYTARLDAAVLEHNLGGELPVHNRICGEIIKHDVSSTTARTLGLWDDARKRAHNKAATAEGKQKKGEKKARKTRLLQRAALRSGAYTYVTSEEQAVKLEAELANVSGSDSETEIDVSPSQS